MSSSNSINASMLMSPAQQGIFYGLVSQQIPQWLLKSDAKVRNDLYNALIASFQKRSEALSMLQRLKSPENFCMPLLTKALADRLGKPVDVAGVVFQHARSTSSLFGLRKKLVTPINRDLLSAACENFEQSETDASNQHASSLLYIPENITGRGSEILSIEPNEFARLCRTLDLGKQYQEHVKTLFSNDSAVSEFRAKLIAYNKSSFVVDVHVAYLRGHITADVYELLKSIAAGGTSMKLGNNTLGLQKVRMRDVPFHGVMFIGPVSEHDDEDYRCVMYLPGDPLHPVRQYSSFSVFEVELSRRLRQEDFRKFFLRFVSLEDREKTLRHLETLNVKTRPLPSASIYLPLDGDDFSGDMFTELFHQRCAHVIADTRLMVVPTADKDEATRLARLEAYKSIGLNALTVLLSFVPWLNGVLLAVSAAQLLMEVYDGIEAWSRGEQEQATDYLFDTVENLIVSALISTGASVVGKGLKIVRSSPFVQQLRKVQLDSGSTRLWKPDLTPYRQQRVLPEGLQPDDRGLLLVGDDQYARIGPHLYAVEHYPATESWKVLHPTSPERYRPVLETNNVGAWRHDSELPSDWDFLTLFRRLGIGAESVSDAHAGQVLAASGLSETTVLRMYIDDRRPASLLMDVVERFKSDRSVTEFIKQMQTPSGLALADQDLQLHLMPSLPRWPEETAISIINILGHETLSYGPSEAANKIKVTQLQVRRGEFHGPVLGALKARQREHLLGTTSTDANVQAQALRALIVSRAQDHQQKLFERVYLRNPEGNGLKAAPLVQRFARLPIKVAEELVINADLSEWRELEDFRVPLRMVEEASRYLRILRVNRAYEGLYLDLAGGADTDRLILDTLAHLPGWPSDHFVQIMDWVHEGYATTRIGAETASTKTLIDVYPNYLQARDANNDLVADHPQNTRALYFQTLWEGLSASCRAALGVSAADAGMALRQKITLLALDRREQFSLLLDARGTDPVPAAFSGTEGLPSGVTTPVNTGAGPDSSSVPALVHRARELYPLHTRSQIDRFLATLGNDDVLRTRKLETLRLEYQAMHQTLARWVAAVTRYQPASGPRVRVPRHSKLRAAREIIRAWRKETATRFTDLGLSYSLSLPAEILGSFPVFVADFSHITALELNKVGTSSGLLGFCRISATCAASVSAATS